MADQKTKPTNQSVTEFLNKIEDEQKRHDCFEILAMMERATQEKAVMWGSSIVGFGKYHYKYASGHEGDSCLTGFSPRKQNITLYLMADFNDNPELLKKLGKHKTSVGCLYIKRLVDVDKTVLQKLIEQSVESISTRYQSS